MTITFEPLTENHFSLLLKWLETPHVKAWWDQDVHWTPELIEQKYRDYVNRGNSIKSYIICIEYKPIGYIQYYNVHDFPRGYNFETMKLPESCAAIDWYIGEIEFVGCNGQEVLKSFLDCYVFINFGNVFVDPDTANTRAIRVYEKVGFKKIDQINEIGVTLMIKNNKKQPVNQNVSIRTAPYFSRGDGCLGWWLKKEGSFSIILEVMPSGVSERMHYHRETEQFFYCLKGTLSIELNNEKHILRKGDGITVPSSVPHNVYNSSNEKVEFLVISCPNLLEDRVDLTD